MSTETIENPATEETRTSRRKPSLGGLPEIKSGPKTKRHFRVLSDALGAHTLPDGTPRTELPVRGDKVSSEELAHYDIDRLVELRAIEPFIALPEDAPLARPVRRTPQAPPVIDPNAANGFYRRGQPPKD